MPYGHCGIGGFGSCHMTGAPPSRSADVASPCMTAWESRARLNSIVFGAMATEVLYTAAKMGIADHLSENARDHHEIAEAVRAAPPAMGRLLRAMAAIGLLTEPEPGHFALTEDGAMLQSDRPDSMRTFVTLFGDPAMLAAWRELEHAVRTGDTTFDRVFGTDFFNYLSGRPALSVAFNAAMQTGTMLTAHQLPAAYDFARFHTVADIGGGDGTLLAGILSAHGHLSGILFDTKAGLAEAETTLTTAGLQQRCGLHTGDFFTEAPAGADLYLLKSIIHDWDDDRCATILGHIRQVIPDQGRLLVVEPVLPPAVDGSLPPQIYLSDLNMMVNVGGQERTRSEFAELFARAGFELVDVTALPAPSGYQLLEGKPRG